VFCRSLFVLFLLAIVLSVLIRFISDFPFGSCRSNYPTITTTTAPVIVCCGYRMMKMVYVKSLLNKGNNMCHDSTNLNLSTNKTAYSGLDNPVCKMKLNVLFINFTSSTIGYIAFSSPLNMTQQN
jgi:hypothetical protein